MAPLSTTDIGVGLAAIAVAAFAIYMFLRASSGSPRADSEEPVSSTNKEEVVRPALLSSSAKGGEHQIPRADRHLGLSDIDRARSSIRTLTLQREILSMVLKRLFEAEDEGEITREERVRLSKGYEAELKQLSEDLKQSELVVTLHELESIRDDILKKFEETLSNTQAKIDSILKELKLEARKEEPRRAPPRRRRRPAREERAPGEEEEADEEEEEEAKPARPKSDVEAKLEQLRMEVLKELEELEKLELEA